LSSIEIDRRSTRSSAEEKGSQTFNVTHNPFEESCLSSAITDQPATAAVVLFNRELAACRRYRGNSLTSPGKITSCLDDERNSRTAPFTECEPSTTQRMPSNSFVRELPTACKGFQNEIQSGTVSVITDTVNQGKNISCHNGIETRHCNRTSNLDVHSIRINSRSAHGESRNCDDDNDLTRSNLSYSNDRDLREKHEVSRSWEGTDNTDAISNSCKCSKDRESRDREERGRSYGNARELRRKERTHQHCQYTRERKESENIGELSRQNFEDTRRKGNSGTYGITRDLIDHQYCQHSTGRDAKKCEENEENTGEIRRGPNTRSNFENISGKTKRITCGNNERKVMAHKLPLLGVCYNDRNTCDQKGRRNCNNEMEIIDHPNQFNEHLKPQSIQLATDPTRANHSEASNKSSDFATAITPSGKKPSVGQTQQQLNPCCSRSVETHAEQESTIRMEADSSNYSHVPGARNHHKYSTLTHVTKSYIVNSAILTNESTNELGQCCLQHVEIHEEQASAFTSKADSLNYLYNQRTRNPLKQLNEYDQNRRQQTDAVSEKQAAATDDIIMPYYEWYSTWTDSVDTNAVTIPIGTGNFTMPSSHAVSDENEEDLRPITSYKCDECLGRQPFKSLKRLRQAIGVGEFLLCLTLGIILVIIQLGSKG